MSFIMNIYDNVDGVSGFILRKIQAFVRLKELQVPIADKLHSSVELLQFNRLKITYNTQIKQMEY